MERASGGPWHEAVHPYLGISKGIYPALFVLLAVNELYRKQMDSPA